MAQIDFVLPTPSQEPLQVQQDSGRVQADDQFANHLATAITEQHRSGEGQEPKNSPTPSDTAQENTRETSPAEDTVLQGQYKSDELSDDNWHLVPAYEREFNTIEASPLQVIIPQIVEGGAIAEKRHSLSSVPSSFSEIQPATISEETSIHAGLSNHQIQPAVQGEMTAGQAALTNSQVQPTVQGEITAGQAALASSQVLPTVQGELTAGQAALANSQVPPAVQGEIAAGQAALANSQVLPAVQGEEITKRPSLGDSQSHFFDKLSNSTKPSAALASDMISPGFNDEGSKKNSIAGAFNRETGNSGLYNRFTEQFTPDQSRQTGQPQTNSKAEDTLGSAADARAKSQSGEQLLSRMQFQTSDHPVNQLSSETQSRPIRPSADQLVTTTRQADTKSPISALQQLQQIVDSSSEQDTVTIRRADPLTLHRQSVTLPTPPTGSVATASDQMATAAMGSTSVEAAVYQSLPEETNRLSSQNSAKQLTGIRQDAQQQYLDARIQMQNSGSGEQDMTSNQQANDPAQQSQQSAPAGTLTNSGDATGIFSLPGTSGIEQPAALHHSDPKPVFLPSGTVVQEQEIVEQIINRFRVTSRNSDSQINIKLHPAELGEMKVDITVKEGSIRANVIAQSQQIQEILEKNISKLKSVLENQGFTVEDITVTSKSENVGDFNLFDQQFGNKSAPKSKNHTSAPVENFNIEELTASQDAETTQGVDLKI